MIAPDASKVAAERDSCKSLVDEDERKLGKEVRVAKLQGYQELSVE